LAGKGSPDVLDGSGSADRIDCGKGSDTVTYVSRRTAVSITLDDKAANDGNELNGPLNRRDLLRSVENAIGGLARDVIRGNSSKNRLLGSAGDDVVHGRQGNDSLNGGPGADELFGDCEGETGCTGDDSVSGSSGNDLLRARRRQHRRWRGGERHSHQRIRQDTQEGGDGDDSLDGKAGDDRLLRRCLLGHCHRRIRER
jgi:Ca2+-binding RTX toxin-like protein